MCYSGREVVAKPAGNLWQADFHPTATREHQSGNRLISEDIEISESKYKLNKKYKKHLHKPNKITTFAAKIQIDKRLIVVFLLKTQLFLHATLIKNHRSCPF